MPPSPLLSAVNVMMMYLSVVCRVSVQMIQLSIPSAFAGSTTSPEWNNALSVYKGEVPISPNTMPVASSTPPSFTFL